MATYEDYFSKWCVATTEIQKLNFQPDLLKSPIGKNFRAISEATILKTINETLYKHEIDYSITVKEEHLEIKEVQGRLVFIATCIVRLDFYIGSLKDPIAYSEATGMGIDDGDKAAGKAYTYAVKYALMKKFRITYSDDPDATESKPIEIGSEGEKEKKPKKPTKPKEKESQEPLITENQTKFIVGLVHKLGISAKDFKAEWGYYPSSDKIPMRIARQIIDDLKAQDEGLPF